MSIYVIICNYMSKCVNKSISQTIKRTNLMSKLKCFCEKIIRLHDKKYAT